MSFISDANDILFDTHYVQIHSHTYDFKLLRSAWPRQQVNIYLEKRGKLELATPCEVFLLPFSFVSKNGGGRD